MDVTPESSNIDNCSNYLGPGQSSEIGSSPEVSGYMPPGYNNCINNNICQQPGPSSSLVIQTEEEFEQSEENLRKQRKKEAVRKGLLKRNISRSEVAETTRPEAGGESETAP